MTDIEKIRAQMDKLGKYAWLGHAVMLETLDELQAARAEVERLRAALEKYGDHRWKCAVSSMMRSDKLENVVCDCGWSDEAEGKK